MLSRDHLWKNSLFLLLLLITTLALLAGHTATTGAASAGEWQTLTVEDSRQLDTAQITPPVSKELIAFAKYDGNIYSIEPDGSNLTQLTNDGINRVPRISPDGTKIAFCKRDQLHTMDPDGSNVIKLSDVVISCGGHFNWSPDSSQLLVVANINATGHKAYVYDIAADTYTLVPTPNHDQVGQTDWSPDGIKISFAGVANSPTWNLYIQNIDGTGQQNITERPRLPAFSPDGSQLVYERCCAGHLRIINVDGTGDHALNNLVHAQNPRWSPDGSRIVYLNYTSGVLRIINADGTNDHVVPNTSSLLHVDWGIINLNSPPTADAGGSYQGVEGSTIALDAATAADEDDDPLTYGWTVDSPLCTFSDAANLNPTVRCADDGSYTITLTVDDGVNEPVSSAATLDVNNVAPTVESISVPLDPVNIYDQADHTVDVTFTDPAGTLDEPYTCEFDLDFNDSSFTVDSTIANVSGTTCSTPLSYAEPGVYSVKVAVTDHDGDTGMATAETLTVVYDPTGGFVTGGGWIDSPADAYKPDPVLTGKASFGFVSKYKKGASAPSGNTEFNFKAGALNFHSSEYDWLVINQGGSNAQFKGVGAINGQLAPNGALYKFMLWAGDDEPDTFRIKIWYEDGDEIVVYDNGVAQPIGGGNIVVHTGK